MEINKDAKTFTMYHNFNVYDGDAIWKEAYSLGKSEICDEVQALLPEGFTFGMSKAGFPQIFDPTGWAVDVSTYRVKDKAYPVIYWTDKDNKMHRTHLELVKEDNNA